MTTEEEMIKCSREYFCEKCSELGIGIGETWSMLCGEHDGDILCPTCYNKRFPKVKVG